MDGAIVLITTSTLVDSVISNADGSYFIDSIPPGNYTVVVKRDGFREHRLPDVVIKPSTITFYDPKLVGLNSSAKKKKRRKA